MLATPAAVRLPAMLAVGAVWWVVTPLVARVGLAVSVVMVGGWLVITLAALAALTPPMPPPLGGPHTRPDTRPDTRLGTHRIRRVLRPRGGAPVPPPPLTAASAAAASAAAAAAAATVAAAAAALAAVAAVAAVAALAALAVVATAAAVRRTTTPRRGRAPPSR